MLYLSSLAVQFSRTIRQAFLLRSSPSLRTRLRYYTISRSVCQGVFQKFFNFFQATRCLSKFRLILSVNLRRFLFKEAQLTSTMSISLALRFTRPLYYIISSRVCQEVLKKFFKFFSKPFDYSSTALLSLTVILLYHIFPRLSTPFSKKIEKTFLSAHIRLLPRKSYHRR